MDDDPVLVSLAEDLRRDDPRLADLLDGGAVHRRHRAWFLLALPLLVLPLLLPLGVVLGLVAVLAIVGAPLAVCWLLSASEGPLPGRP